MLNEMTGERHLTTLPPSASASASASATNQTSVNLYYCGLVLPPTDATLDEEKRREREKERELEWKRLIEGERPGVEEAHLKYRRRMLENGEDCFVSRSKKNKKWGGGKAQARRAEKAEKVKMKLMDCKRAIAKMFGKMGRSMAPPQKDRKAGTAREVLC